MFFGVSEVEKRLGESVSGGKKVRTGFDGRSVRASDRYCWVHVDHCQTLRDAVLF